MRSCLILLLSIFSCVSSARDLWVEAIGIDELHRSQNFGSFYKAAHDFESACSKSIRKPECVLFINPDNSLSSSGTASTNTLTLNAGQPSSAMLTKFLTDKIALAKPGDTVILGLKNHGAPVAGLSPACIWFSSTDFICENEIKAILDQKPPGVKVFVNADACFSGDFTKMAGNEICVATTANRFDFGTGATKDLWRSVLEGNPDSLTDLQQPWFKDSGTQQILASQTMLAQLCRPTREILKHRGVQTTSDISFLLNIPTLIDQDECPNSNLRPRTAGAMVRSVLQSLQQTRNDTCSDLQLPDAACQSLRHLRSANRELKKSINSLSKVSEDEEKTASWFLEMLKHAPLAPQVADALLATLSKSELDEMNQSFGLSLEPDWSKFVNPKHRLAAKKLWQSVGPILIHASAAKRDRAETNQILQKLKESGDYNDLMTLQTCLNESELSNLDELPNNERDAGTRDRKTESLFPEKTFSPNDYEAARKCESSIHF
jgi:hypothetical protein